MSRVKVSTSRSGNADNPRINWVSELSDVGRNSSTPIRHHLVRFFVLDLDSNPWRVRFDVLLIVLLFESCWIDFLEVNLQFLFVFVLFRVSFVVVLKFSCVFGVVCLEPPR